MNDNTALVVLILGILFLFQRSCDTKNDFSMMQSCLNHQGFEWRDNGCVKIVEPKHGEGP